MPDKKSRRRRRRKKRPVKWKGGRSHSRKDYRTQEYVRAIAEAEAGIYQSFVMSDYQLTDRDVRQVLKTLVRELREQNYTLPEERDVVEIGGEEPVEEMVVWVIKINWERLFEKEPRHSDEDLVGCLGVISESIETWSTPAANSRGYLWYNAGFMQSMGMWVEQVSASPETEAAWEEEEPTEEDALREMGEDWLDDPTPAQFDAFRQQARAMLEDRQAQEVINACQYLIGWTNDEAVIKRLSPLIQPAYRQLGVPFRSWKRG
ncbi:MAG: hypothetical protein MAG451_00378 [Anaerolineales bacterium]|nr:hypothetical protein [Anaerolineales bacterium]